MSQHRTGISTPASPFPLLPLRTGILLPGTTLALPVGRPQSIALLDSLRPGDLVGVVPQRDSAIAEPTDADLHRTGTLARLVRAERGPDRVLRAVLEGLDRFTLTHVVRTHPFWLAEGTVIDAQDSAPIESRAMARALREHLAEITPRDGTQRPSLADEDDPGLLADQVAALIGLSNDQAREVLETPDVSARLTLVTRLLAEAKALQDVKQRVDARVRKELDKHQREALLREQMKALRKEMGDERGEDELSALRERIANAELPEDVRKVVEREFKRLEAQGGPQAEASVIRNYLELILDLPWSQRADVRHDIEAVARKLDEDHQGLEDVKRRILEHMAVLDLTGNPRGTLLCLAGPPGVGKTSLGQSIADATGRPFVRIALGGVRDEAEIRGHRRTYVGALPGRIVHALRKAKVRNPVVLLDEIDKLGTGWGGSPEAALLEVLDPEQNRSFTDHYLELPFDLSEVLFICTANQLENLSAPLRDRLEVIELSGYTTDEKLAIARQHLIPKQLREHGVTAQALTVTDGALRSLIEQYTREAGVRQLTREIAKLCRSVALDVARRGEGTVRTVDSGDLSTLLGRAKFFRDVAERTSTPGVATGLAWTPVGGDVLFVETSRMPGRGTLEITGQLGDVMKESARAALTYVRSNARTLGVDPGFLESHDVHIHVPAGAVPKDGPSAGVTMFTALTSLLTGRRVRPDTAMTGECTLRGRVMPVGGIKSKVLAAHRAGITRVVIPARNAADLDDVPVEVRHAMEFILATDMREVLDAALEPAIASTDTLGVPMNSAPDNDRTAAVRSAA